MKYRRHRPAAGFTLVEILVAMAIFATVAALGFAALRFVAREQETLTQTADLEAAAAACLERMARDLSSIYVSQAPIFTPPLADDPPSVFRVTGGPDEAGAGRLNFASLAHVSFEEPPRRGIARIGYRVQGDGAGKRLIRRSDRLFPDPTDDAFDRDPVLCENVKGLEFRFFDRNGESVQGWDSASEETGYASPRAVRIILTVDAGEGERFFDTTVYLPVQREPATPAGLQP